MRACVTLDLEPDYGGWIPPVYTAWDEGRVRQMLGVIEEHGARLTVFVVGQSIAAHPRIVELLLERGAEFHLHSHSHDLRHPDSLDEIARGAEAFEGFFGHRPEGYRAPQGRISPLGWENLDREGFSFDSSIFPSFWPAPRYLRFTPKPFRPAGRRLLELPISALSPLRIVVALSWMNLLGWPRYKALVERGTLPEPLVFAMHLHDLWDVASYRDVPRPWRWLYRHDRDSGIGVLSSFLALLKGRGHRFATLGEVAAEIEAAGAPC